MKQCTQQRRGELQAADDPQAEDVGEGLALPSIERGSVLGGYLVRGVFGDLLLL
jgi:hypothetical protein